MDGFSWAENLAFDGIGSLFVSDAVTGKLWRIYLCGDTYCKTTHLADAFDQFGGLAVTPDGTTLFAGVTFTDGSHGVVKTSTAPTSGQATWDLVAITEHQPNGMAGDWQRGVLYCTDEGVSSGNGTVVSIDIKTGVAALIKDDIGGADGAWFDEKNSILFIGELLTMKIWVYDVGKQMEIGSFPGLNSLGGVHMMDDIVLDITGTDVSSMGKTKMIGTDWTGRQVMRFTLDGSEITKLAMPEGVTLKEPTSARWGRGPGFSETSLYVTEGGGATKHETGRRVFQL